MTSRILSSSAPFDLVCGPALLRGALRGLAPALEIGSLHLELPSGETIEFRAPASGPDASVRLVRWRALWKLLSGGDIGFAEAFVDGEWTTPDLRTLLEFAMHNERALSSATGGTLAVRALDRLRHFRRRNTRRGSRRNIAEHYDLGNAFYAEWLDSGMNYSSAIYRDPVATLEQAQAEKIDRVVELLDLRGGERILEIGCGWGALAERLVRRHGCHVTGLTLSREQYDFASERLAPEIAEGRAEFRLQDYRDAGGSYDRVVSIEMLEAVGESYWPQYFVTLKERLREGGKAVLQVITIAEERFAAYRARPDFIQRHIFPGGMLPTPAIVRDQAVRAGLSLSDSEHFGEGYVRTLQEWHARFRAAWPRIAQLGFDERFRRLWEYYLVYCEVGFASRAVDVGLFRFER